MDQDRSQAHGADVAAVQQNFNHAKSSRLRHFPLKRAIGPLR
jgi:hypothetical protein